MCTFAREIEFAMNIIKQHTFTLYGWGLEEAKVVLSLVECPEDGAECPHHFDIQVESEQEATFAGRVIEEKLEKKKDGLMFVNLLDSITSDTLAEECALGEENVLSEAGADRWYKNRIGYIRNLFNRLRVFAPDVITFKEEEGPAVPEEPKDEPVQIDNELIRKEVRTYLKENLEVKLTKRGATLDVRIRLDGKTVAQDEIAL